MTATSGKTPAANSANSSPLESALGPLERLLESTWREDFGGAGMEELAERLRGLHALLRRHEAAQQLFTAQRIGEASPQHADELRRLLGEHTALIGMLDRLVRQLESVPSQSLEDKEVFYLRGRELFAVLRRHGAEEDRLFFSSLWQETGGES
jgi:hypothetical protein